MQKRKKKNLAFIYKIKIRTEDKLQKYSMRRGRKKSEVKHTKMTFKINMKYLGNVRGKGENAFDFLSENSPCALE